jgi:cobalt-zinc-cadmium efflux system membrane fusion protein
MNQSTTKFLIGAGLAIALTAGAVGLYVTGNVPDWVSGKAKADEKTEPRADSPKLLETKDKQYGVELSPGAVESLELKPIAALAATKDLALPPMIGTVNYDADRLFAIKPRFTGEVSEIKIVDDPDLGIKNNSPGYKNLQRPLKFGDRVKKGETLAVFWSKDVGENKAALVDAICSLHLSKETLERQDKLYKEGGTPYATVKLAERQVQADSNAAMTAERTLRMWKLTDSEIKEIKDEAQTIADLKLVRDVVQEVQKWARVELKVPTFDPINPKRELTILEKNTHLGDMVDPANYNTPLFRIADLSRLQIWVHPPEEYLPAIRKQMAVGPRALRWKIRFQAESGKKEPLELPVEQLAASIEPNTHTPMLVGYLDNPEYKYLIGQFVTATILISPPPDTVEIPTDAINPLNGQDFVFVENPGSKTQFLIRRVSVVQSLKKTSYVRTKLSAEQEQINLDVKEGEYPIQPLNPGDRVVTRGVVELTAALEELRNSKKPSEK